VLYYLIIKKDCKYTFFVLFAKRKPLLSVFLGNFQSFLALPPANAAALMEFQIFFSKTSVNDNSSEYAEQAAKSEGSARKINRGVGFGKEIK